MGAHHTARTRLAPSVGSAWLDPGVAQLFWQRIYNDLALKTVVPVLPKLAEKQMELIRQYNFLLLYLPALDEERYPKSFTKLNWRRSLSGEIERLLLVGRWVAVETITKPSYDDSKGYSIDPLMAAVDCAKRFSTSHTDLTNNLLGKIAKVTAFPEKSVRLPSAEEWNLIGNLFHWLRVYHQMNLPNLGSTDSWEWCANNHAVNNRLIAGYAHEGGLAGVGSSEPRHHCGDIAFRVLLIL